MKKPPAKTHYTTAEIAALAGRPVASITCPAPARNRAHSEQRGRWLLTTPPPGKPARELRSCAAATSKTNTVRSTNRVAIAGRSTAPAGTVSRWLVSATRSPAMSRTRMATRKAARSTANGTARNVPIPSNGISGCSRYLIRSRRWQMHTNGTLTATISAAVLTRGHGITHSLASVTTAY